MIVRVDRYLRDRMMLTRLVVPVTPKLPDQRSAPRVHRDPRLPRNVVLPADHAESSATPRSRPAATPGASAAATAPSTPTPRSGWASRGAAAPRSRLPRRHIGDSPIRQADPECSETAVFSASDAWIATTLLVRQRPLASIDRTSRRIPASTSSSPTSHRPLVTWTLRGPQSPRTLFV